MTGPFRCLLKIHFSQKMWKEFVFVIQVCSLSISSMVLLATLILECTSKSEGLRSSTVLRKAGQPVGLNTAYFSVFRFYYKKMKR